MAPGATHAQNRQGRGEPGSPQEDRAAEEPVVDTADGAVAGAVPRSIPLAARGMGSPDEWREELAHLADEFLGSSYLPGAPPPPQTTSRSRRCKARWKRAWETWREADVLRRALNEIEGHEEEEREMAPRRLRPKGAEGHDKVHLRLLRRAGTLLAARRALPTGVCWRSELKLASQDTYRASTVDDTYVPIESDLVAEPPPGAPSCNALQWLPSSIASVLADPSRLLRPEAECPTYRAGWNKRYNKILGPRCEYVKYFHKPGARDLWELAPESEAEGYCSFACVLKKDMKTQRKILMVVPFNHFCFSIDELFGDAGYGLMGAGALDQVKGRYEVGTLDQSNAFTHIEAPPWWRRFQAAPRLRAAELPAEWGKDFSPGAWVRPLYKRLPMGSTLAVFVLCMLNRVALLHVNSLLLPNHRLMLMNEKEIRRRGVRITPSTSATYIHVDDFSVMSALHSQVVALLELIDKTLRKMGFVTTFAGPGEVDRYIGLAPLPGGGWAPWGRRLAILHRALTELVENEWVCMPDLVRAIGIFIHFALLKRSALSLLHAYFKFAQADKATWRRWWPSARWEVDVRRRILPLLYTAPTAEPLPFVLASDASGPGDGTTAGAFCLAMGTPPAPEVEAVSDRAELSLRRQMQHPASLPFTRAYTDVDGQEESLTPWNKPEEVRTSWRELCSEWGRRAYRGEALEEVYGRDGKIAVSRHRGEDPERAAQHRAYLEFLASADPQGAPVGESFSERPLAERSIHRTVLPRSWFSEEAGWKPFLARRWRYSEHISRGEARGALVGLRLTCRAALRWMPAEGDFILLSLIDNQPASATWLRGRSGCYDLNQVQRSRFVLESQFGLRHTLPWTPTSLMPADSGTRPINGVLKLLAPEWSPDRQVLWLSSAAGAVEMGRDLSVHVVTPWLSEGPRTRLNSKEKHSILTRLSTGKVAMVWIEIPMGTWRRPGSDGWCARACTNVLSASENNTEGGKRIDHANHILDLVCQIMVSCHENGVPYVAMHAQASLIWATGPLIDSLIHSEARHVLVNTWSQRKRKPTRWRIVTNSRDALRVARQYAGRHGYRGSDPHDDGFPLDGSEHCPAGLAGSITAAVLGAHRDGGGGGDIARCVAPHCARAGRSGVAEEGEQPPYGHAVVGALGAHHQKRL